MKSGKYGEEIKLVVKLVDSILKRGRSRNTCSEKLCAGIAVICGGENLPLLVNCHLVRTARPSDNTDKIFRAFSRICYLLLSYTKYSFSGYNLTA